MLITPGGDIRSLWEHGCVPPERYFWAGSKTLADYRVWRLGGCGQEWILRQRQTATRHAVVLTQPLFVSQGFDRIEARSAEGRNHAADQAHGAENERGRDQRPRSDDQADVAGFPVFGKGAVQGEPSHRKRDRVGQYHSQHPADEGNGQSFGEELQQDVPPLRAQGFLHANLTRALRDRNQHDIHQADAADAECKRADETHQDLQPERNDFELMDLSHQVEHFHSLPVRLVELVLCRQDGADRLFQALVLRRLVGEPDGVQVMCILQLAHSAERDVYHAVYIVISLLHFGAQDTDDFEAEAVNPDVLP